MLDFSCSSTSKSANSMAAVCYRARISCGNSFCELCVLQIFEVMLINKIIPVDIRCQDIKTADIPKSRFQSQF